MKFVPAALPFFVKVAPPRIRFGAVLAVMANRVIQTGLSFLDPMAAFVSSIRVRRRRCYNQKRKVQQQRYDRGPTEFAEIPFCLQGDLLRT